MLFAFIAVDFVRSFVFLHLRRRKESEKTPIVQSRTIGRGQLGAMTSERELSGRENYVINT